MPTVDIHVLDGAVDVRVNERGWSKRFTDSVRTVRRADGGRAIVGLGGMHSSEPVPPNVATDLRQVFDAAHFDPDVAVAFVRYCSVAWTVGMPTVRATLHRSSAAMSG